MTSNWWFDLTKDLVPNHLIASPHPNVTICKRCTVFPVEFVVRGYITGSTSTSMWTNYAKGVRNYCGHLLPEDLTKNQKLSHVMLTPTTKDDTHDELISAEEIIASGRMTEQEWETCRNYALKLFEFSQEVALTRGLLLVDTKYEFGRDLETGEILLIDEIQTPDSSRYWLAHSYEERFANQQVRYLTYALTSVSP
jgi:phosphoribosylaminoimidazole-succinocarboxamide synthase